MDDSVKIPIQLEVTDLNMGNVDAKDLKAGLKSTMSELQTTFEKFAKSIDKKSATPELMKGLKELNRGYRELEEVQAEFNKAVDEGMGSAASQAAAEKFTQTYNRVIQKYSQVSELQAQETNLNSAYTDRLAIIKELATELKYYKELAKKGEETYGDKEWEKIDSLVKSTAATMKEMLDETRELVKTGEAFKLGGDKGDISEQLRLLQSYQGQLYGNTSAFKGYMGTNTGASQELVQATYHARELAAQLALAERELDALRHANAGEVAIAQAVYRVKELTTELQNADRAVEVIALNLAAMDSGDIVDLPDTLEKSESSANDLKDTLESLVEVVAKLADTVKGIDLKLEGKQEVKETKENIKETDESAKNLKATISAVKTAFAFMGISGSSVLGRIVSLVYLLSDAFTAAGSAAQTVIPILGVILGVVTAVVGKMWNLLQKLLSIVKQLISKVWELVKAFASIAAAGIVKTFEKVSSAIGSIVDKMKEIFSLDFKKMFRKFTQYFLGFRSSYFLIRKIRQVIIDGMKDIAAQAPEVNAQMSAFSTALNEVKGRLVSAFQPVLSVVLPILTAFLNIIAKLLTYLAKFFAVLTGQGYYYDFTADMVDYGDALNGIGKAAKKATKDLMGFDEINRLTDKDTAGSGIGAGLPGEFKKSPIDMLDAISKFAKMIREAWQAGGDFTEVGKTVGESLSQLLDKFNKDLLPKAEEFGLKLTTAIGTFINGLTSVPELGRKIGTTLANIINTIVSCLRNLIETINWKDLGKFIGEAIDGWFKAIDLNSIALTITGLINGISNFIINAVASVDWEHAGRKIADAFITGLKNWDAAATGKAIHDFVYSILTMIGRFLDEMDIVDPQTGLNGWQLLGKKIKEFFSEFKFAEVAGKAGECAGKILKGLAEVILEADPKGDTFGNAIDSFLEALKGTGWYEKWKEVWENVLKPQLLRLWNWLKPILLTLALVGLSLLWEGIKAILSFIWGKLTGWLGDQWTSLWGKISGVIQTLLVLIGGFIDSASTLLSTGASGFFGIALSLLGGFSGTAGTVFSTVSSVASTTVGTITAGCSAAASIIPGPFGWALELVSGMFTTTEEQVTKDMEKSSRDSSQQCANNIKEPFTASDSPTNVIQNQFSEMNRGLNRDLNSPDSATSTIPMAFSEAAEEVGDSFVDAPDEFTKILDIIKQIFQIVPDWFKNIFADAWQKVQQVFSSGGAVFGTIQDGITNTLKSVVNGIIGGINQVIVSPFNAINSALKILRNFSWAGYSPFKNLPWIDIPSIPKLAQGAVLPPNNPFLSIVGDQKHGTNVEAPLETIQQAVAEVMGDQLEVMMAGFEAVVNAIQEKNLNVTIGDREIGQASNRYNNSQNIRRGYV